MLNLKKKHILYNNKLDKNKKFKNDYDSIIIHIKTTLNNTLLTLTNFEGDVLVKCSAGSCGFKGSRKSTPFAAKKVVEFFIRKSSDYLFKCSQIKVHVCGFGPGRESALRGLSSIRDIMTKIKSSKKRIFPNKITVICEMTKIPHNGCRPPKKRRL